MPFAAAALVVLQKTLNLPVIRRKVTIHYTGATLLIAGVCALLIWCTLAGTNFAWASIQTVWFVSGGVAAILAFLYVETRAAEPIVPLRLFRDRTTALSVIASIFVGIAMFGPRSFSASICRSLVVTRRLWRAC